MPQAYQIDGTGATQRSYTAEQVVNAVEAAENVKILCVIEDIDSSWELIFKGAKWDVDADFFGDHGRNAETSSERDLWDLIFNFDHLDDESAQFKAHIQGIFEYPSWIVTTGKSLEDGGFARRCWKPRGPYPISSHTKMSYIFPKPNFCKYRLLKCMNCSFAKCTLGMILVDSPLDISSKCTLLPHSRSRTYVRFPYSRNRGGLLIPALYENFEYSIISKQKLKCSLFENFVTFCQHPWHLDVLFQKGDQKMQPHILLYLLSSSIWRSNLQNLDQKIKEVSFKDLRRPDMSVNTILHDCREDLFNLRGEVNMALDGIELPDGVDDQFTTLLKELNREYLKDRAPRPTFNRLIQDADKLSQFLIDSFSILISSVSTRDSQTSLEQAKRGTVLTQLAFIYVPLSFVTGIYGMNTREINGSPLSVWVAVVTLIVIIICTGVIFGIFKLISDRREQKKSNLSQA